MQFTSAEALRQAALRHTGNGRGGRGHMATSTTSVTSSTTHRSAATTATINPVLEKPVLLRSFCSRLVAAASAWNFPVPLLLLLSATACLAFLLLSSELAAIPLFLHSAAVAAAVSFCRHGSRSSSAGDRHPPSGLSCISKS